MDFNFRNQQQQMSSGLTRYHSAPSSLLADFINGVGEGFDDFLPPSPESESVLARFISGANGSSASPDIREIDHKQIVGERSTQFMAAEQETKVVPQQSSFSSDSAMIYQREQLQNCSPVTGAVIGSTSRAVNSIAIDSSQVKSSSNSSNLVRHSSSPAGFFSHLTVENGYAVMSDIGNFTVGNGSKGETASTSRLRNPTNFISRKARFPETLSQLSHMRTENMAVSIPEEGSLGNANSGVTHYIPGHPISSWNDSPLGNDLTGLKRLRDNNGKVTSGLSPSDVLNGELGDRASGLKHQFSFPKTSLEIDAMEKFLDFQDSIPCKIRAKRGCATHPRSIAERVRRTRISERIRKLEELVPNMDKQTNTADMLDLAVEYIKELQKQVKGLTDNQASCTCSSKAKARPESCMIKEQTDRKEVKASLILDPDNNRTGIA